MKKKSKQEDPVERQKLIDSVVGLIGPELMAWHDEGVTIRCMANRITRRIRSMGGKISTDGTAGLLAIALGRRGMERDNLADLLAEARIRSEHKL